jgi:hypothetical protein
MWEGRPEGFAVDLSLETLQADRPHPQTGPEGTSGEQHPVR